MVCPRPEGTREVLEDREREQENNRILEVYLGPRLWSRCVVEQLALLSIDGCFLRRVGEEISESSHEEKSETSQQAGEGGGDLGRARGEGGKWQASGRPSPPTEGAGDGLTAMFKKLKVSAVTPDPDPTVTHEKNHKQKYTNEHERSRGEPPVCTRWC